MSTEVIQYFGLFALPAPDSLQKREERTQFVMHIIYKKIILMVAVFLPLLMECLLHIKLYYNYDKFKFICKTTDDTVGG